MMPLAFGLPGGAEWIILVVVALLVFGGSRLAGLGKGAGRAIREFKEETQSLKKNDDQAQLSQPHSSAAPTPTPNNADPQWQPDRDNR